MATIDVKFTATIPTEELTSIWERIEQILQERGIVVLPSSAEVALIEAPQPSCANPREECPPSQ